MQKSYPEKKVICVNCIFCDSIPPICTAFNRNTPISQRDLYARPTWCPFIPYPKLF